MYALVEIKGKQYRAEKGSLLKVDRFDSEAGKELEFESVLLV
jgi:large subunit ribosomal protein L21